MATPRKTGNHGSPMVSLFYRDVHFRADQKLLERMYSMANKAGLSLSEMMRLSIERFLDAAEADVNTLLPTQTTHEDLIKELLAEVKNDDPSNPLG